MYVSTFSQTIYKCKTHANASILLKNKSKEQSSPQLISIDSMISLNKMNRKIIKDIPWIITLISPHISSIQHVCPNNQWYQTHKIIQSVEWEKKTMNTGFLTWKTSEEIKNHEPITDWKTPLWRIKSEYKVLPNSSQPILPELLD